MRAKLFLALLFFPALALAQQSPSRLCVASFRNETTTQFDLPKLRDMLVSQIKLGNLARNKRLEVLPLNGDTDEKAAPEVRDNHCDFVAYSRLTVFRLAGRAGTPTPDSLPSATRIGPYEKLKPEQIVPGIQFTVIRAQSGIPILIDRRFSTRPFSGESDFVALLQPVSDRIQSELEKRLLPAKTAN